jgi:hypothetical protein
MNRGALHVPQWLATVVTHAGSVGSMVQLFSRHVVVLRRARGAPGGGRCGLVLCYART